MGLLTEWFEVTTRQWKSICVKGRARCSKMVDKVDTSDQSKKNAFLQTTRRQIELSQASYRMSS